MRMLTVALSELVPVGVLFLALLYERRRRKQAGERPPQQDKLLREPGRTLRLQLEEKHEAFNLWLVLAMFGGVMFGTMLSLEPPGYLGGCFVGGVAAIVGAVMGWRTLLRIRPLRLGLLGEQAVAEHLQGLVAQGYRLFHDVPGGGAWNIDHVAVSSAGVFAVETKARTKRPGRDGRKDYEVSFDGERLKFPWGTDTEAPAQARRNAEWLAREMSKATGERVNVRAILALPGWFVMLNANSELKVLNAKQISAFVSKEPPVLAEAASQRIAYQLDQRCRDVEC